MRRSLQIKKPNSGESKIYLAHMMTTHPCQIVKKKLKKTLLNLQMKMRWTLIKSTEKKELKNQDQ
jgi:hypothetical protein